MALRAIPRMINLAVHPPKERPDARRRNSSSLHGTIEAVFGFTIAGSQTMRWQIGLYPAKEIRITSGTGGSGGLALVSDKGTPAQPVKKKKAGTAVQSKDRDMGAALRSVYQKTVDEEVPDEFMSLLGKLD